MTWEWPIAIYLWVAGIAGGAYFGAFLIDRFTGGRHKLLMKVALLVGVPLVGLGSLLLILDLGEQLRFWHLFTRFTGSPMSLGVWILIAYAVVAVVMMLLWALRWRAPEPTGTVRTVNEVLSWIALVLAVLVMTYTGVLLSATNEPLWARVLFLPALFVASAISTGTALLLLVARLGLDKWVDRIFAGAGEQTPEKTIHTVGNASAIVGVIESVVLVLFLVWLASFSTPAAASAVGVLVSGPMSLLFWGGVVLIGLLIPLVLEFASMRAGKEAFVGSILASASLVLLGGLILRVVVLLGGQMM